MGIFSKTAEYAMRAVFYIAQRSHEGQRTGIKEIADAVNSPEAFLAKILQKLSKVGLIQSVKGPNGGFYIDTSGFSRPLADIVIAVEGDTIFKGCGMGLSYCSEEYPCPLHGEFKKVRNQITLMLRNTTIGQFNAELIKGQLTLNK
ncbi:MULTISPECIES: RrF2 family transcriptional regulator [Olivibacter]|jgi:Rrf2 family protein|uniref:Transcriptional regulator, BadM/Rrf2 family n=3 Tax=Sphingobacteriaceae TaxID=84566 RepID=F4CEW3_SPHS2|nr:MULTISPECIES: Rrf2 family transcriptional regulator [Olivibacter]MCL4642141.1 Rrf2 family transcriptional regulator [Olivibacter sp. UJ_SKK_5.1]MDM8176294.1 Rrf2 family transcriptional regulator [Olivibacter sp. 47]MDX3915738.1 Rrf2 family transcriptional regulator [Pseudosphingobacterium sp.]QEL01053.1 Rrf2 family transcriptional regulator [Olivibacter sp. LS-1]